MKRDCQPQASRAQTKRGDLPNVAESDKDGAAVAIVWLPSRIKNRIVMSIADRISVPLYRSGILTSPLDYALRIIRSLLFAASIAVASVACLAVTAGRYLQLSVPFTTMMMVVLHVPLGVIADLFLRPLIASSSRKKLCERELPFFATYLTMAAASGISMQAAFERLKDFRYLPQFGRESLRVEKVRRLYALHPYEAILFEGKYHPADYVKDLYYSAVTAQKEGGEVFVILRDEMLKLFSILQGRLRTVSDKFSLIASAEMVAFIMFPMGVITIGVLFSSILGLPMLITMCLVFPTLVAVLLSFLIDSYVPKELTEPIPLKGFFKSLMAFPVALFLYFILQNFGSPFPFYYVVGPVVILFTLPVALSYSSSRRRTREILAALPSFTRSVAEEVKKGNSPRMAITNFSERRTFNRSFDRLLHKVATYLKVGCPIVDAITAVEAPWIAKVSFELLDKAEMMGAEPKSLDSLSDLVGNIYLSYKSLDSQTRLFTLMSYVNTLVLSFSVVIAVDVVATLFTGIGGATYLVNMPLGISFITPEQLGTVETIAYTAVVYDAFLLGVLGGKASNGGSVVDGLKPGIICLALSLLGIILFKELGLIHALTGGFGGTQ